MIDIHNHTLYGVDDGPDTIEESIQMLKTAKKQGIDAIILTPHYRHGMFSYPKERIEAHFEKLEEEADTIGIGLYLGCEYHVGSQVAEHMQSGRCHTLADSDYVLTEYSYESEYSKVVQNTQKLINCGYIPVIAHAERYRCFFTAPERCEEMQEIGALIQLNADSVLGKEGWGISRFCKKVLKNQWADVIASDAHNMEDRSNHLGECRAYVVKKYGHEYADDLFNKNPFKMIHH